MVMNIFMKNIICTHTCTCIPKRDARFELFLFIMYDAKFMTLAFAF
jgi:hypothetical protein